MIANKVEGTSNTKKNSEKRSTSKMSSSFKVLKLNELFMVWIRIYSHQHLVSIPTNDFFKSITTYYISFGMLAFITSSAVFVYQNISNVVLALRTATVLVGTCQSLGMFLSVGCKIDLVKLLHQKFQAIVDQAAKGKYQLHCLFCLEFLTLKFSLLG